MALPDLSAEKPLGQLCSYFETATNLVLPNKHAAAESKLSQSGP